MAQTTIDTRIAELGIVLPEVPVPAANYVPFVRTGNLLYLSGQGPRTATNEMKTGKVGADVSWEEAYQDARLTGLQLIAVARHALDGDLGRVRRVVKLLGMVNATPDFGKHPMVINGCSDLLVEVFGDRGRHARSAVGMGSLPGNITVEIEATLEVD